MALEIKTETIIMPYLECLPKILDCRLSNGRPHKGLEHEMDTNQHVCLKECSLIIVGDCLT